MAPTPRRHERMEGQGPAVSSVIVIGAGAGGLATAARLASRGHRVTLLEQRDTFGGKLSTYRRDGFAFDTGPSLFTLPAVYRDLFLKTGGALEDAVDLQELEPAFGYRFADGSRAVLPGSGIGACANALGDALGGTAAEDWKKLMARASDMWRITRRPFLQSPLDGLHTLLPLATNLNDVRTIAPFTSLRSLGNKTLRDPRLVTLLDRYATYQGSDPRKAPAVLATVPYVEQVFGAWHLGGGLGTLADALVKRCEERGVTLRASVDVTRILLTDGRATGVELADGDRLAADVVVANADASLVYEHLLADDATAKRQTRRIKRTTPSLAGFVMLLAVKGSTPNIQHHNVWFPENYDDEFTSIFGRSPEPVSDPAIYACVPADPRMSPPGHEAWFILVNAPRHGTDAVDWNAPGLADRYADEVLARLAERGTDLRERVLWREVRTPADLERDVRAPGGSIYGTSSNGSRAAFQRPANRSPIPGLFLVGGSAHPGGGLPLVGMSAEIVADLIGPAKRQADTSTQGSS